MKDFVLQILIQPHVCDYYVAPISSDLVILSFSNCFQIFLWQGVLQLRLTSNSPYSFKGPWLFQLPASRTQVLSFQVMFLHLLLSSPYLNHIFFTVIMAPILFQLILLFSINQGPSGQRSHHHQNKISIKIFLAKLIYDMGPSLYTKSVI